MFQRLVAEAKQVGGVEVWCRGVDGGGVVLRGGGWDMHCAAAEYWLAGWLRRSRLCAALAGAHPRDAIWPLPAVLPAAARGRGVGEGGAQAAAHRPQHGCGLGGRAGAPRQRSAIASARGPSCAPTCRATGAAPAPPVLLHTCTHPGLPFCPLPHPLRGQWSCSRRPRPRWAWAPPTRCRPPSASTRRRVACWGARAGRAHGRVRRGRCRRRRGSAVPRRHGSQAGR